MRLWFWSPAGQNPTLTPTLSLIFIYLGRAGLFWVSGIPYWRWCRTSDPPNSTSWVLRLWEWLSWLLSALTEKDTWLISNLWTCVHTHTYIHTCIHMNTYKHMQHTIDDTNVKPFNNNILAIVYGKSLLCTVWLRHLSIKNLWPIGKSRIGGGTSGTQKGFWERHQNVEEVRSMGAEQR